MNLLKNETSPYLQQHKNNPVDWFPWCDEAFQKAKAQNKAIFISIGYSSCHWCHVMEKEVFENERIAQKLNKNFICIKVDREERPDIDKFYQEVHMLLNRRAGGWPTSIFSTPENKPFFAGTYIPPKTQNNILGFEELIDIIAQKIAENDPKLFSNANEIQTFLKPSQRPKEATHLTETIVSTFLKQCEYTFDKKFGGFGKAPKFPQASTLKALLNIALIDKNDKAMHMCIYTLDNISLGGMYDLIDGGFCRYSTDDKWLVPHFEKMAYDNALLCELYLHAYKATNYKNYLDIAKQTAQFMIEKMSRNALFYSASDADSNGGIEGEYYIYEYEEVVSYLTSNSFTKKDAKNVCASLNITPEGNFEGKNIVRLKQEVSQENKKVFELLKQMREDRHYPFIDKKIITAWNAMMIKSLFILCEYEEEFLEKAVSSLEALLDNLYINEHLYHSTMIDGKAKIDAFLEDYAYLATALIQAYQTTLNENYLFKAQNICNKALELFFENGRWYFSKGEFITEASISDGSYPGSASVMVDTLISLGVLVDEKYRRFAFMSLEYYSKKLAKEPIRYAYLFNQALRYIKEDRVLKGNKESQKLFNTAFLSLKYPYMLRSITYGDEAMLCGIQSCYANIRVDSDLNKELEKTL